MSDAAQQQPASDEKPLVDEVTNPIPEWVVVPALDGEEVRIRLSVVDGVVYAPNLDGYNISAQTRQYVSQFCALWSHSEVLNGPPASGYAQKPPRRAVIRFGEAQLRAMLALAPDEVLRAVVVEPVTLQVEFVVESPRLPRLESWDVPPSHAGLPLAAWYDGRQPGYGHTDELSDAATQLAMVRANAAEAVSEWQQAIDAAEKRLARLRAQAEANQSWDEAPGGVEPVGVAGAAS